MHGCRRNSPERIDLAREMRKEQLAHRKDMLLAERDKVHKRRLSLIAQKKNKMQVLGLDPLNDLPEERKRAGGTDKQTEQQDLTLMEMNEKWKKARSAHYDLFDNLLTAGDHHRGLKTSFDEQLDLVQGAIDFYGKHFPVKQRAKHDNKDLNKDLGQTQNLQSDKVDSLGKYKPRSDQFAKTSPNRRGSTMSKDSAKDQEVASDESIDPDEAFRSRIKEFFEQLEKEKNYLWHRIYKRKYEQQVLGGRMKDFDDLVNRKYSLVGGLMPANAKDGGDFNSKSKKASFPLSPENQQKHGNERDLSRLSSERKKKIQRILNACKEDDPQEEWVKELRDQVFIDMEKDRKARSKQ